MTQHVTHCLKTEQKKCVQLHFPVKKGGWGAEYKRVKDLSHWETVFHVGAKKNPINLSGVKNRSPIHAKSKKH